MPMVGRRDEHGVDVVAIEQLAIVFVEIDLQRPTQGPMLVKRHLQRRGPACTESTSQIAAQART